MVKLSYRGLFHFIFLPAVSEHEWSIFLSFLAFGVNNNFNVSQFNSGYLNLILTYISLMANDVEHLLMCLMSSECPFGKMSASFLIALFLMLSFESSLYSLDVSLRLDMCFASSFSGCILSFCPWIQLFTEPKPLLKIVSIFELVIFVP